MLLQALTLQAGFNAALVTLGAGALGAAAGTVGGFLYLRKRSLVSDAISHATLPGLALAFMVMVALGFEGRWLPGLMLGSAVSAGIGLWLVGRMTSRTRLPQDAAIGAVLSVFFGFGIVLLTLIQTMEGGRQAGLEGFLLGATAGMLRMDVVTIAAGGGLVLAALGLFHRPLLMVAFDEGYATVRGISVRLMDAVLMALVLAVTVIGLRIVGLVLIVALLIIPAVAARFWTQVAGRVIGLSAAIGGFAGYAGAALSATAPALPTGPLVVLVAFGGFAVSALFAPTTGALSTYLRHCRARSQLALRSGLKLAAKGHPLPRPLNRLLTRQGLLNHAGLTPAGQEQAQAVARDDARWRAYRHGGQDLSILAQDDGVTPLEDLLPRDAIAALDAGLPLPEDS